MPAPLKHTIKLVTFDAYQTLFKPRGSTTTQYIMEAKNVGINVGRENLTKAFGPIFRNQMQKYPFYGFKLGMNPRHWWEELVYNTYIAAGVSKEDLDPKFEKLFDSLYMRFTSDRGYAVFPDAVDCLKELQKHNIYTGVISNSDERLTQVLKSLRLTGYLHFVLPSYRAGYEKPDKRIFDRALGLVNIPIKPEEALHVGDDLNADYRGAHRAGWNALLLNRVRLSYEEPATPLQSLPNRPDSIMTLHDLYPCIENGFNNVQKEKTKIK